MNSADKKLSGLEEPEFVWMLLYQEMTQKSMRKADSNWTDQNSEDHKCFSCVVVRLGDRVIDVRCAKQDVISLSALQFEFYTLTTGGPRTIHTNYLDRDRIKRCMTKMGILIAGAWAGEQVACGFGHWSDQGEDLIEGQSWTIGVGLLVTFGVVLLSCTCIVHSSHLPTGRIATREPGVARQPSCMTLRSMRAEIINH